MMEHFSNATMDSATLKVSLNSSKANLTVRLPSLRTGSYQIPHCEGVKTYAPIQRVKIST